MEQPFEDRYFDVLQNIEFAIVETYRHQPDLIDAHVDNALSALMRIYKAEGAGHNAPSIKLSDMEKTVFESIKAMCEWRLGRAQPTAGEHYTVDPKTVEPKTYDEIVACLKRIRKSVNTWTKEAGRQGYLEFISQFIE